MTNPSTDMTFVDRMKLLNGVRKAVRSTTKALITNLQKLASTELNTTIANLKEVHESLCAEWWSTFQEASAEHYAGSKESAEKKYNLLKKGVDDAQSRLELISDKLVTGSTSAQKLDIPAAPIDSRRQPAARPTPPRAKPASDATPQLSLEQIAVLAMFPPDQLEEALAGGNMYYHNNGDRRWAASEPPSKISARFKDWRARAQYPRKSPTN